MKRYSIILVTVLLALATFSCQNKIEVKPDTNTKPQTNLVTNVVVVPIKTNTTIVTPVETNVVTVTNVVEKTNAVVIPDKFDNTDYKNVIKVLRESIDNEKATPSIMNILYSGKAHALVAKFMRENISEVRYGFTEEDIQLLKTMATMKFKKIIKDNRSSAEDKAKAENELIKTEKI